MTASTFTPLEPRDGVLLLTGYGLRVAVDRGHLIAEDGLAAARRQGRFPRVRPGFNRVVVLGHAGTVSLEALRWLHDLSISFVHIGADAEVVAATGPRRFDDARLRRAQAFAGYGDAGLAIVRELTRRKVEGQRQLLIAMDGAETAREHLAACLNTLPDASHMQELRFIEASAAGAYWAAWRDLPMRFATLERRRVPAYWSRFGSRISPLSGTSARRAVNPANAILNYLYAILESEARIALLVLGLDPGLGIMHTDKASRSSLALDLMEPVRPLVDRLVLDLLCEQVFRKADFFEQRDGGCRLLPPVTEQCALRGEAFAQAVAPHAEWLAQALARLPLPMLPAARSARRDTNRSRSPDVPKPLTREHHRQAAGTTYASKPPEALSGRSSRHCTRCGAPRSRDSDGLCRRCLHKEAPGLQAARAAIERKKERGQPLFSRSTLAAQKKKMAAHHADRRKWLAANPRRPSVAVYRRDILPRLKQVTIAAIAEATGMSLPYCCAVRGGKRVPHPVHWETLGALLRESPERRGR
jgi:CRISPR-associated endonuclease Cas1